jgi:hypothetical protein
MQVRMIGSAHRAVAADAVAQAVVALHREDLLGVLAGQQSRELDREHRERPRARHQRGHEGAHRQVAGDQPGERRGAAAGAEQRLEAGDHQVGRVGREEGVVGVARADGADGLAAGAGDQAEGGEERAVGAAALAAVHQTEELLAAAVVVALEDFQRVRVQVATGFALRFQSGDGTREVGVRRVAGVEAAPVQAELLAAAVGHRRGGARGDAALPGLLVEHAGALGVRVHAARIDLAAAAVAQGLAVVGAVLRDAGVGRAVTPAVALHRIAADVRVSGPSTQVSAVW